VGSLELPQSWAKVRWGSHWLTPDPLYLYILHLEWVGGQEKVAMRTITYEAEYVERDREATLEREEQ
jgi:hypothetical protein